MVTSKTHHSSNPNTHMTTTTTQSPEPLANIEAARAAYWQLLADCVNGQHRPVTDEEIRQRLLRNQDIAGIDESAVATDMALAVLLATAPSYVQASRYAREMLQAGCPASVTRSLWRAPLLTT